VLVVVLVLDVEVSGTVVEVVLVARTVVDGTVVVVVIVVEVVDVVVNSHNERLLIVK
tara:strand:- start:74 stop:244 length:171 start_codon:yes stop_codon:yes gene_type:complete